MELVAGPGGVMFWSMSYDPEAGKTTQRNELAWCNLGHCFYGLILSGELLL